jgi:hypothetical protein
MDMKTEIYIRDIEDVSLKNAEGLHTSGLLKVGVPNCKNKEKLSEVTGLLKDYFLNVSEKTCEAGMESLLTIGVDIPIINSTQGWTSKTSSTTALVTQKSKDGSSILVNFVLNKTKFANLNSAVKSKFFDTLSFDESTVSFSVNNDGRQDEVAIISDSFVDGKPIIHSKRFTLARRNKIDVEPSNVRRISFSNSGSMPVLEIPIISSKKATLDDKKNIEVVKDNSRKTQGLNSLQPLHYTTKGDNLQFFTAEGKVPSGCFAQLMTELNGDDLIASVFLNRTGLRGCIASNIPYPEENTKYQILDDMGDDNWTVRVCQSIGGSMGSSCSKILVHFENREYQANNKQIKVLSVNKLGELN